MSKEQCWGMLECQSTLLFPFLYFGYILTSLLINCFSLDLSIHKIITFHLSLPLVIQPYSASLTAFSINIHYSYLINLPLLFRMNWDPRRAKSLTNHFDNSSMLVAHCTEKICIIVPSYYNIMQIFVHWLARSTFWLLRAMKIPLSSWQQWA